MTEKAFNAIFAKNLRNLLQSNGMSQKELAKRLSVGTSSVLSWCRGEKSPLSITFKPQPSGLHGTPGMDARTVEKIYSGFFRFFEGAVTRP